MLLINTHNANDLPHKRLSPNETNRSIGTIFHFTAGFFSFFFVPFWLKLFSPPLVSYIFTCFAHGRTSHFRLCYLTNKTSHNIGMAGINEHAESRNSFPWSSLSFFTKYFAKVWSVVLKFANNFMSHFFSALRYGWSDWSVAPYGLICRSEKELIKYCEQNNRDKCVWMCLIRCYALFAFPGMLYCIHDHIFLLDVQDSSSQ